MKKPILTIMCGIARCGKSTWVKRNKKDDVIICPDVVRRDIFGHQYHIAAEGFVWSFSKGMCELLLKQGKNVILDATNTLYDRRKEWLRLADTCGAKVRIVWVQTSLDNCKRRNKSCDKSERVPEEVLDRMSKSFDIPCSEEYEADICFELIKYKPKERKHE